MGIQFSGLASGLDTTSIISDLMQVERTRVENVEKKKVLAEWKKDALEEMNSKIYSFYKTELYDFKSQGTYNQKTLNNSNEDVIGLNSSNGAVRGSHEITVNSMAKGSFLTGTELVGVTNTTTAADMFGIIDPATETISISLDGGVTSENITIEATDTMGTIVSKIQDMDMDLNVSFDSNFNRMFFSSTETGLGVDVNLSGSEAVLDGLGFAAGNRDGSSGSDANFEYNGASFTSSSNEVSVNGLSFNILANSGSSTISVTQDTDAIYDSVKNFVQKYNELMVEMNEKIGADSASDYAPLTDDEKSVMTDDDIELWETTIKDSLLRRDGTLTSITTKLRNTMTMSSGIDTSDFTYTSLSALGIVTGSYEEKGLLHIEGDEDDSLYSIKTNKLRDAIDDDPDAVMELLSSIGDELYSNFSDRMKSSTLSSALTFYNDKYLDSQIDDYEDDIYDLEDMMDTVESRYYAQFTAMEQAIQQANSTGDWLTQQLGGM